MLGHCSVTTFEVKWGANAALEKCVHYMPEDLTFAFGDAARQPSRSPVRDNNYGNRNVTGFAPGQVGGVPPAVSQFTFQMQMYEQMYGRQVRRGFARSPIFTAIIFTPLMIFLSYVCIILGRSFSNIGFPVDNSSPHGLYGWAVALVCWVVVWALALFWAFALTFGTWLVALALHRRNGGVLAPWLTWIDQLGLENEEEFVQKYPRG